ncbi:hypothetical protein Mpe_B0396 (plasmid) [Methylibium petroleiphilum PM1]|uniref:Uncharacterized protein n=1 Tax=Methylibium petroleiphilum (strain ATCC BAA-1232 / LMG 22953 / PM1) TaxID=420662 RepID=A2SNN2_METPP|nr:hypothetical protein Mpe_B0396 [Methylibium petroleiphilum PM1]
MARGRSQLDHFDLELDRIDARQELGRLQVGIVRCGGATTKVDRIQVGFESLGSAHGVNQRLAMAPLLVGCDMWKTRLCESRRALVPGYASRGPIRAPT